MPERPIRTYFYKLTALGGDGTVTESDYLWSLFTNTALYVNGISTVQALNGQTGKRCELRDVSVIGNVAKGCLALLRDDAPSLRLTNGNESPLQLAAGERLIEKNYFLYFRELQTVVWHFNLAANHIANLGLMLTTLGASSRVVTYSHVVKSAFSLDQDQVIEYVDLKISYPKNSKERNEVEQLNPTDWGIDPFKILSDSGSRQLSVILQNRTDEGLKGSLRRMVDDLTDLSMTRRLKVRVDGADEPVDMLTERYTYKIPVQFNGHSPGADEIFQALQQAKDKFDAEQNP